MGEQTELLEVGQLARGWSRGPTGSSADRDLDPTGSTGVEVLLDDLAQHEFLTIAQHDMRL